MWPQMQKQGKVQIICGENIDLPCNDVDQQRRKDMTDHTHKKVHIKPEGSPNPLQSHSQIVVKVDRYQVEEKTARRRPDHKCNDSPDLSVKDRPRIQHQVLDVECRCHHLDQYAHRIQDHDIIHEIRNRVPSEFPLHLVHKIH